MTDEPAARAHALLEQLFAILHECHALVPQLERGPEGEAPSAEALLRLDRGDRGKTRPYRGGCPHGASPGRARRSGLWERSGYKNGREGLTRGRRDAAGAWRPLYIAVNSRMS